jgi:hypothetical protein
MPRMRAFILIGVPLGIAVAEGRLAFPISALKRLCDCIRDEAVRWAKTCRLLKLRWPCVKKALRHHHKSEP